MALNKVKLRLKQETEEETALKQKYEQLRRKKARRLLRRAAERGAGSLACFRAPVLTQPGSASLPRAQEEKERARLAKEGGEAAGAAGGAVRRASRGVALAGVCSAC
jgi:CelD/BcsL family acetyltransferase involved in cellulose biosynthesis